MYMLTTKNFTVPLTVTDFKFVYLIYYNIACKNSNL